MSYRSDAIPIACTLPTDEMAGRVDEWRSMLTHAVSRTPVDGGVRVQLDPAVDVVELARLVQAEQHCCAFFAFAITVDGRGVGLEVRAPDDAVSMVESLFG